MAEGRAPGRWAGPFLPHAGGPRRLLRLEGQRRRRLARRREAGAGLPSLRIYQSAFKRKLSTGERAVAAQGVAGRREKPEGNHPSPVMIAAPGGSGAFEFPPEVSETVLSRISPTRPAAAPRTGP